MSIIMLVVLSLVFFCWIFSGIKDLQERIEWVEDLAKKLGYEFKESSWKKIRATRRKVKKNE